MIDFEREMYADPGQDLNTLWWDNVEKHQGIQRPDDRDAPDWASKIHLATAPVYYQNYLLGELYASHLRTYLLQSLGGEGVVGNLSTGAFFQQALFDSGCRYDWRETLVRATGEALNPQYWGDQFAV